MNSIIFSPSKASALKTQLRDRENQIADAVSLIKQMEAGNLEGKISGDLAQSPLGQALLSIKNHLKTLDLEQDDRNRLNTGLAKFSDILRNKQSLNLKTLANDILINVVKYVNANQGALFILNDDITGDEHLEMIACYAYDREKHLHKKINIGDGLAGQCVLEKETIYLKQVPEKYLSISSGLGEATPRRILITPLLINGKVFGVLELASFNDFTIPIMEFVKKLSENIAATIKNEREADRVLTLLNASQQQAEELRAQEEEMRQNMEELQATQEEMQRKTDELTRTSAETRSLFNGINATMATIEFTPEGFVLTANTNFLNAMKYRHDQIEGQHHSKFVPAEIISSSDYKTFWKRLSAGESITGIFRRSSSEGKTIWLNAIYNPILDGKGKVIKVMKLASDITAQQEALAENKDIMNGINATMATIEFTPEGHVITANANFLKIMKYPLTEIKGLHHRKFVPRNVSESADYKNFWQSLSAGESIAGIFDRTNSIGELVSLNAIYNPVRNANGDVIKVIKFATEVISQKQSKTELRHAVME